MKPLSPEDIKIGIYEKALPKGLSWDERFAMAKRQSFDFVEMSIDEADERLARLDWSGEERLDCVKAMFTHGIRIPSICLSGHRRFPLGSHDPQIRLKGQEIMTRAIDLASDLGVRVIQLAGYDVYYEDSDEQTLAWFLEGLKTSLAYAAKQQVMLSMEIMDTKLMSSITRYLAYKEILDSPWFTVYPDIGNLSAWGNDVRAEFLKGINQTVAIHLKDTLAVTQEFPGKFKEVPFGEGCVDFVNFFSLLLELEYQGPFLIEMWTEKSDDPEKAVKAAKDWILAKMREGRYAT